jgi:exodeoxyribonuclease III
VTLCILSYNILEGGKDRLPLIGDVIQQQQPDVVALLEARSHSNVEALAQQLGMSLTFGEANNINQDHVVWLSHIPVARMYNHRLPVFAKTLLEIEIPWNGTPLALFATHLKAGQDLESEQRRVSEMQEILAILRQRSDQPHILVGDLNTLHPTDRPNTPEYIATLKERGETMPEPQFPRQVIPLLLEAGYVDCYRMLHPSIEGYTSHTTHPALRVDYIFASAVLARRLYECDVVTGAETELASDHFPIWAEFR